MRIERRSVEDSTVHFILQPNSVETDGWTKKVWKVFNEES